MRSAIRYCPSCGTRTGIQRGYGAFELTEPCPRCTPPPGAVSVAVLEPENHSSDERQMESHVRLRDDQGVRMVWVAILGIFPPAIIVLLAWALSQSLK